MDIKKALSHVFWIGGPANSGKTTIANIIAWQKGYQRYSYDKNAMDHFERLSIADAKYRALYDESFEESWASIASGAVLRQTLETFEARFPLVLQDLLAIPTDKPVLAEGIGLTPDLVYPLLSHPAQAIWLIPDTPFMENVLRQKIGTLQIHMMKEPGKTLEALLCRDQKLSEAIADQVKAHNLKMIGVDGLRPKTGVVSQVLTHFGQYRKNSPK